MVIWSCVHKVKLICRQLTDIALTSRIQSITDTHALSLQIHTNYFKTKVVIVVL